MEVSCRRIYVLLFLCISTHAFLDNSIKEYRRILTDPEEADDVDVCSDHTSCYDCVGLFAEDGDCYWCPGAGVCESSQRTDNCNGGEHKTTCTDNTYTVIFLSVFGILLLLCCTVCYCKVKHRENDGSPLLPEQIRGLIFRNSLADLNEVEWMCVICGYDNRPRANDCPMCGTSKKFTIDYKTEKKDKYKRKLEKAAKKKAENKVSYFGNPVVSNNEDSGLDDSRLSISALSFAKRGSMSAMERLEALNYRRLNTLSLRQKGARRRRMWQR